MPKGMKSSPNSIRKAKDAKIREMIYFARCEKKITVKNIAKAMNITEVTFRTKVDKPENMTLGQFRALRELIGITDEELLQMI